MDDRRTRRLIGGGFLLLWIVTLFLPVARSGDMAHGYEMLMMGWLGFIMLQFAWFGNLLFFVLLGFLTFERRPLAWLMRVLAVALLACVVDALFWRNIPTDASDGPITEYAIGYYLWIVCMTGLAGWAMSRTRAVASDPADV